MHDIKVDIAHLERFLHTWRGLAAMAMTTDAVVVVA